MTVRLGVWAIRDFRRLVLSQTISLFGNSAASIALAFAILDMPNSSPTDLGTVLFGRSAAQVLFVVFGGVLADRLPRYKVMVGSELLAGAAQIGIAALVLADVHRIHVFAALSALNGAAASMFLPAASGFLPQIIPPEQRQSANAFLRTASNAASIAGAMTAAGVIAAAGPGWALVVDAASFWLSAALLAGIEGPRSMRARGNTILNDLRLGWGYFASQKWIWSVVLQFAILNVCSMCGLGVLGPIVADRQLGGASAWSVILAARSAGFLVGSLVAMRVRPPRTLYFAVLLMFSFAPPFLLLATSAPVVLIAMSVFIKDLCGSIFSVLWATTLQHRVPESNLSRVSSYDALGSFILGPLGLALAGPVANALGLTPALMGCAGLSILATSAVLLVREVREVPHASA